MIKSLPEGIAQVPQVNIHEHFAGGSIATALELMDVAQLQRELLGRGGNNLLTLEQRSIAGLDVCRSVETSRLTAVDFRWLTDRPRGCYRCISLRILWSRRKPGRNRDAKGCPERDESDRERR